MKTFGNVVKKRAHLAISLTDIETIFKIRTNFRNSRYWQDSRLYQLLRMIGCENIQIALSLSESDTWAFASSSVHHSRATPTVGLLGIRWPHHACKATWLLPWNVRTLIPGAHVCNSFSQLAISDTGITSNAVSASPHASSACRNVATCMPMCNCQH